jgi:DNA (cytosine-5)-methyltransferase 1
MSAYYNEIDPYAAQWLRNLIDAGHIAPGDVDERSIVDVRANDLRKYTQCHFFAGIAGWSLALRLAGWPDDRPVWTGSCPCQPFSAAGRAEGVSDDRDLWSAWAALIAERGPAIVFGEQVAGSVGFGWFDRMSQDLEAQAFAVGACVLPATSVGAPHRRNRLFFVAHASGTDPKRGSENRRWSASPQAMAQPWAYANWRGGISLYRRLVNGLSPGVAKGCANGFGNAIVPQVAAEFIKASL